MITLVERVAGDIDALLARPIDLETLRQEAVKLRDNPFGNLARLVRSSLHLKTEDFLIVTDLEADAPKLRSFARKHFFAYRALRAHLMRDEFIRVELEASATGFLGRVTAIDVFRYIAKESGGAAAVSLDGKAAMFLLPGFHSEHSAEAALRKAAERHLVLSKLTDYSNPRHLSLVVRLHARHEGAHSEDDVQHRAGLRNRYAAEPESDAAMTLFARRDAKILGTRVAPLMESLASLREVAAADYFFCSRAICRALEVDQALLLRMRDSEIAQLADAIADSVVPSREALTRIELGLAEMRKLTRELWIHRNPADPRHERMKELLSDAHIEAWLSQTLSGFEHFGLCPEEEGERVLEYAKRFYEASRPRSSIERASSQSRDGHGTISIRQEGA